jgi:hypothetical protein
VLESFDRIDDIKNQIDYYVEDATGAQVPIGSQTIFTLNYDGSDRILGIAVFDPVDSTEVIFTSELTFNVDNTGFVRPDPDLHLIAENAAGADIVDSLGQLTSGQYIPAGFRGSDIRMGWIEGGTDSLPLEVRDLDNVLTVPFGDGIVDSIGEVDDSEKGSNWSFLPVGGGTIQPGGRYFLTAAPIEVVDLWICGARLTAINMDRMPVPGDVWTLRQVAYESITVIDTLVSPPDTTITFIDVQRPPAPGTRYRLDTESGGPVMGEADLSKIRVVPNPYLASAAWDVSPSQKRLEFINLPPECTIRIYTISGVLVRILDHTADEGGTEVYDLLTRESLSLASGNYYYHVTTPDGKTHLGRFAVVQ